MVRTTDSERTSCMLDTRLGAGYFVFDALRVKWGLYRWVGRSLDYPVADTFFGDPTAPRGWAIYVFRRDADLLLRHDAAVGKTGHRTRCPRAAHVFGCRTDCVHGDDGYSDVCESDQQVGRQHRAVDPGILCTDRRLPLCGGNSAPTQSTDSRRR